MTMETAADRREAPRKGRSYKDSDAYRRSQRMRVDGQPIFPLPFATIPSAAPPAKRRPPRYGLIAALLTCAAVAVVLERRR